MLTTFVIALREGLEASLIVGIIAAFLKRQGRPDALRSMWVGVGLAVAALRRRRRRPANRRQRAAPARAGGPRDDRGPRGRRDGHLHDRLDDRARPRPQGPAAGAGRRGAGPGLGHRARRHGLPRRPARGLRDLRLPARRLQRRGRPGAGGPRRRPRPRRGRRARLRDLPRRRAPEPLALLPRHRRGPRARGRGARRLLAAHGGRGRLGRRRSEPGARPERDHPPGHGLGVAHHRHPRHPRPADGDRGRGLAALRHPDARDRPRARRRPPARAGDGGRSRRRGRPGRPARRHPRRQQGDRARRSPAAAPARGPSTWRSPTRAAHRPR